MSKDKEIFWIDKNYQEYTVDQIDDIYLWNIAMGLKKGLGHRDFVTAQVIFNVFDECVNRGLMIKSIAIDNIEEIFIEFGYGGRLSKKAKQQLGTKLRKSVSTGMCENARCLINQGIHWCDKQVEGYPDNCNEDCPYYKASASFVTFSDTTQDGPMDINDLLNQETPPPPSKKLTIVLTNGQEYNLDLTFDLDEYMIQGNKLYKKEDPKGASNGFVRLGDIEGFCVGE